MFLESKHKNDLIYSDILIREFTIEKNFICNSLIYYNGSNVSVKNDVM